VIDAQVPRLRSDASTRRRGPWPWSRSRWGDWRRADRARLAAVVSAAGLVGVLISPLAQSTHAAGHGPPVTGAQMGRKMVAPLLDTMRRPDEHAVPRLLETRFVVRESSLTLTRRYWTGGPSGPPRSGGPRPNGRRAPCWWSGHCSTRRATASTWPPTRSATPTPYRPRTSGRERRPADLLRRRRGRHGRARPHDGRQGQLHPGRACGRPPPDSTDRATPQRPAGSVEQLPVSLALRCRLQVRPRRVETPGECVLGMHPAAADRCVHGAPVRDLRRDYRWLGQAGVAFAVLQHR